MVTITEYKNCISQEGREFLALVLQGEVTVATSKEGNFYLTANKTSIPTSFNEKVCQTLIGKTLAGSIHKVPCESFQYTNHQTGETVTLNYRYQYSPREDATVKQVSNPMEMPQQHYQHVPFMPMANQMAATA